MRTVSIVNAFQVKTTPVSSPQCGNGLACFCRAILVAVEAPCHLKAEAIVYTCGSQDAVDFGNSQEKIPDG